MTTTKYGSLYPKEFLNYFGNNENLISNIDLQSDQYSIDDESTFDDLQKSLNHTFNEIETEFKNIKIEID